MPMEFSTNVNQVIELSVAFSSAFYLFILKIWIIVLNCQFLEKVLKFFVFFVCLFCPIM